MKKLMLYGLLLAIAVALFGCASQQGQKGAYSGKMFSPEGQSQAKKEAPAPADTACPARTVKGDLVTSSMAVPTGDRSTSVLLLERTAPAEVTLGKTYEYTIDVINLTDCALDSVIITDRLTGGGFEAKGSTPEATMLPDGTAQWDLGTIPAKGSKQIRGQGVANNIGDISQCLQASYVRNLCQTVKVSEPQLKLVKTMPAEATLCDDIPVRLVVSNPGTGALREVTVTDTLPAGLTTADGKGTATFDIGALNAGESREVNYVAKAQKVGEFENAASAKSAEGLTADAKASVTVRQAVLTIDKTGPDFLFVGREARYAIKVGNAGDTVAKGVVVKDMIPAGTSFVAASAGGAAAGGTVTWNLGDLAAGDSKDVTLTVRADSISQTQNTAMAEAVCANPAEDSVPTTIKGIPAVLLEVLDVADPVEVGAEETYIITVTNQGSLADTNIAITCTLEDSQAFVSASGATVATQTGQVVKFAPLATLAPKAKAEWKLVVKAVKADDVRFSVEMNTDQLQRPVNETESTNQY